MATLIGSWTAGPSAAWAVAVADFPDFLASPKMKEAELVTRHLWPCSSHDHLSYLAEPN